MIFGSSPANPDSLAMDQRGMVILAGNSHPDLAEDVTRYPLWRCCLLVIPWENICMFHNHISIRMFQKEKQLNCNYCIIAKCLPNLI